MDGRRNRDSRRGQRLDRRRTRAGSGGVPRSSASRQPDQPLLRRGDEPGRRSVSRRVSSPAQPRCTGDGRGARRADRVSSGASRSRRGRARARLAGRARASLRAKSSDSGKRPDRALDIARKRKPGAVPSASADGVVPADPPRGLGKSRADGRAFPALLQRCRLEPAGRAGGRGNLVRPGFERRPRPRGHDEPRKNRRALGVKKSLAPVQRQALPPPPAPSSSDTLIVLDAWRRTGRWLQLLGKHGGETTPEDWANAASS